MLTLSVLQFSSVSAAAPTLPAGTWWTLKGGYQWSLVGTGSDQGSYMETGNYTKKYIVVSSDPSTVSINETTSGVWSCSGEGSIFNQTCGSTNSGSYSGVRAWTLYTSTLLIESVTINGEAASGFVGHPSQVLVDPSKLSDGGTTPLAWCVPITETNSCGPTATDVQASVSTQQLNLKGSMVKVWVVTYTGQQAGGYQNSAGVYEVGPETWTAQYDPVYGTLVGASWNYKYEGAEPGGNGSWIERYTDSQQFVDSSLTFTTSSILNMEPSAGLYVTVGAVVIVVILIVFLLIRRRNAPPPPPPFMSTGPAAPLQPTVVAQPRFCMNCGSPMTYVDQYRRYYCQNCRQYA